MVVFNIPAIFQVLLSGIGLVLVHFSVRLFSDEIDLLGHPKYVYISLLILSFFSAFFDLKGIKGRVFFTPTWLILMIAGVFFFFTEYNYGRQYPKIYYMYAACILIALYYFRGLGRAVQKSFLRSSVALNELCTQVISEENSEVDFWKIASHVYYKPPNIFFFLQPLWNLFYKHRFSGDEFVDHYRTFVNLVDPETITNKRHKRWFLEFHASLNKADSWSTYHHPPMALARTANLIDLMNGKLL